MKRQCRFGCSEADTNFKCCPWCRLLNALDVRAEATCLMVARRDRGGR